jgi:catalase
LKDGTLLPAEQKVGGGPSVLYDAVALVVSDAGAKELATLPAARDFVADAHAHKKFIAYVPAAEPLLGGAGTNGRDGGYVRLEAADAADSFIEACRKLRFWNRA